MVSFKGNILVVRLFQKNAKLTETFFLILKVERQRTEEKTNWKSQTRTETWKRWVRSWSQMALINYPPKKFTTEAEDNFEMWASIKPRKGKTQISLESNLQSWHFLTSLHWKSMKVHPETHTSFKMELKVWVEGIQRIVCGVTDKTTCQVRYRISNNFLGDR